MAKLFVPGTAGRSTGRSTAPAAGAAAESALVVAAAAAAAAAAACWRGEESSEPVLKRLSPP
jgi:hypothetical protein